MSRFTVWWQRRDRIDFEMDDFDDEQAAVDRLRHVATLKSIDQNHDAYVYDRERQERIASLQYGRFHDLRDELSNPTPEPKTCRLCGRQQAEGYPHDRCPEGKCQVAEEEHCTDPTCHDGPHTHPVVTKPTLTPDDLHAAALARAWSEGCKAGFEQGQKDACGEEYTDTPNPYRTAD